MLSFLFGKKKVRSVKRKGSRKLPARLIKRCRKYRIKCTKKVGGRRVYKKISVIRKLISNKLKKRRLPSNTYSGSLRNRKKVRKTRRTLFGFTSEEGRKRFKERLARLQREQKEEEEKNKRLIKWNQNEMLRFGGVKMMSEEEARNQLARFRAKHGKGRIKNQEHVDFSSLMPQTWNSETYIPDSMLKGKGGTKIHLDNY